MEPGNVIWIGLVAVAVLGVISTTVGPLETRIVADLSIGHGTIGVIEAAFQVSGLIGACLVFFLPRYTAGKRAGAVGLAMVAAGCVLCGVRNPGAMALGRFVTGLGNSFAFIFITNMFVAVYPSMRARLLNAIHASVAIGAALCIWKIRLLAEAIGNWTYLFWINGGVALIIAALLWRCRVPAFPAGKDDAANEPRGRLNLPVVAASFSFLVGFGVVATGLTTFLPAYGEKELGVSLSTAGLLLSCYWVGKIVGRIASAAMPESVPKLPQLVLLGLMGSLLGGLGLLVSDWRVAALCMFLVGGFTGPMIPLALSHAVKSSPGFERPLVAGSQFLGAVGGSAGTWAVGEICQSYSLWMGLTTAIGVLAASIVPGVALLVWSRAGGRALGRSVARNESSGGEGNRGGNTLSRALPLAAAAPCLREEDGSE